MECGDNIDDPFVQALNVIEVDSIDEPMVEINVNGIDLCGFIDTGASRSLLNVFNPNLPLSNERVSLVGVSYNIISARVTQSLPVTLGEHSTKHSFVLSPHSPCNLLGRDLLSKMGVTIALSPDKTVIDIPHRLKDETTDLLFMPLLEIDMEGGIPEEAKQKINPSIWVTGANTPGLMKVAPVRLNRDHTLPVPRLPQYSLSPESVEGIKPVIEELLQEGVLTPCRSSANTPIYPVPKPMKSGEDTRRYFTCVRLHPPISNLVC